MGKVEHENEAEKLIERIAEEIRFDASNPRIQNSIKLILESFAPEHIITELLQNADDAGATFAEIELTNKGVFFIHNGEDFNEKHLRALCDIGQTTKKPGVHIGFMGVGFKATFRISDRPYVFSGPYRFHFKREDVFVPYWAPNVTADIEERIKRGLTTFFLPFGQDLTPEVLEILKDTVLKKLEPLCLVFLRNINEIKIVSDNITRILTKSQKTSSSSSLNKEKVQVTEKKDEEERTYSYLVFKKTLDIPQDAKDSRRSELKTTDITLVFSLREDSLKPLKSVLYTFLPTPFETGLRFAINCDFLLNTQRSEPDFTSRWNLWILESIGNVLKEIVNELVRDEKLVLSLYDVLPRKEEVSERFFSKIAAPLINYMKDHPCVLTSDGKLAKPSEVGFGGRAKNNPAKQG